MFVQTELKPLSMGINSVTTTTLWTAQPLLVTQNDMIGHKVRLMVAEKSAPIQTYILSNFEDAPSFLTTINPSNRYPILIDKNLACFGNALDEFLHERYPHPPLLHSIPVTRAQQRVIAKTIQEWYYTTDPTLIATHLRDLHALCTSYKYLFGNDYSIVDVTVAPFLWRHQTKIHSIPLRKYADRLFKRAAFADSLSSQQAYNHTDEDHEQWVEVS